MLVLPLLVSVAAFADAPLPTTRTVSWEGFGVGSVVVVASKSVTTTGGGYGETDTYTVTANDGKNVTVSESIDVPGQEARVYSATYPLKSMVMLSGAETAVGLETVTVPVGTFANALKTQSTSTYTDGQSTTTSWWVDGVPLPVKAVSTSLGKQNSKTTTTATLTSVTKK